MKLVISCLLLLISTVCHAEEYQFLRLDELSLDYKNYSIVNDHQRNLLIYPDSPKEGINVNINSTLMNYVYFNNTIESLTTDGQYRGIGLQLSLGLRLSNYFDVGYYHHSQHTIDRAIMSIPAFPTEDALQFKLYFYRKVGKDSVF